LQRIEWGRFSSREQQILNRIQAGLSLGTYSPSQEELDRLNEFGTFMQEMVQLGKDVRRDNDLLKATLTYEDAQKRLERYPLAEGREEYTEHIFLGYEFSEDGNKVPICEEHVVPAIDPLPPTLPGYDEEGNPWEILNPAVVKDEAERAEAQAIIDAAEDETLSLYAERNPAPLANPCRD
jgi:hypothetical protein